MANSPKRESLPLLAPGSRLPSAARCSPARSRGRRPRTRRSRARRPSRAPGVGSMTPVRRPDDRGCARPDRRLSATSSRSHPAGCTVSSSIPSRAMKPSETPTTSRRPSGIAVHSMPSGLNHALSTGWSSSGQKLVSATMPAGPTAMDWMRPSKGVVTVGWAGGWTMRSTSRAVIGGSPAVSCPRPAGSTTRRSGPPRSRATPDSLEELGVAGVGIAGLEDVPAHAIDGCPDRTGAVDQDEAIIQPGDLPEARLDVDLGPRQVEAQDLGCRRRAWQ